MPDPFANTSWPKLEYVLKGVKRSQAQSNNPTRPRLPVTPEILHRVFTVWRQAGTADSIMLEAACCMGFFGFLRAAEFTMPSAQEYDKGAHPSLSDVAVDSHANPSMLQVHIKQSKTNPFRKGINIYIGRTFSDICPVAAITRYLAIRSPLPGPLFIRANGSPLSRTQLVIRFREALSTTGLDASKFSGHSFCIGAATTAATNRVEDLLIQN